MSITYFRFVAVCYLCTITKIGEAASNYKSNIRKNSKIHNIKKIKYIRDFVSPLHE